MARACSRTELVRPENRPRTNEQWAREGLSRTSQANEVSSDGHAVTLTSVCRTRAVCLQTESVLAPAAAAARACAKTGTRREHSPMLHRYGSPAGAVLDSARQGCTPRGAQLRTHQESPVP